MLTWLKALIGGSAYATNAEGTGATYLRDTLKKAGVDPNRLPTAFYAEASAYAHAFAKNAAMLSSAEKPVTYFVEHLDYIVGLVQDALEGKAVEAPEPLRDIFLRYGFKAHS